MLLIMKGDQLGLDEDHMFDEFEVSISDDWLEEDQICIEFAQENDCDVSHMINEEIAFPHIRSMLAVMRDGAFIERQAQCMEIDI